MSQGLVDALVEDLKRGRHQLEQLQWETLTAKTWLDFIVLAIAWELVNIRYSLVLALLKSLQLARGKE